MSEKQDTERIRISQVLSGALAAVTAALIGSTMGVAGTVIGAGVASVVSTVGGAFYLRSLQRTGQSVRTVRDRVVARAGSATVTVPVESAESAESTVDPDRSRESPPPRGRIRWPLVLAGSAIAFVLGMAVITGFEWLRGEPLSGGEGTTVGGIVRTQPDDPGEREQRTTPPTTGTTAPPSTGEATTTTPEKPTTTSENTTPSTTESETSESTTTISPTTTADTPTGPESVPPSGPTG